MQSKESQVAYNARMDSLHGIILCGGKSRRMGQPKAWLPLGGETVLARVLRLLRPTVESIIVVAAGEPAALATGDGLNAPVADAFRQASAWSATLSPAVAPCRGWQPAWPHCLKPRWPMSVPVTPPFCNLASSTG